MAASAWEGLPLTKTKAPELYKRSLNWNVFLENWVIPGCKFWAACWVQTNWFMSKNERNCKKDKENAFLGNCLVFHQWSIKYYRWILSFNICSGCAVRLCPSKWLSLLSPYRCPLKPSFPVRSLRNWMKDTARGLLGPRLGPARAQRASLDTSPSIKNQTDSRTHSIPTAERNNVPAAKAGAFYFSSRNMGAAVKTRA